MFVNWPEIWKDRAKKRSNYPDLASLKRSRCTLVSQIFTELAVSNGAFKSNVFRAIIKNLPFKLSKWLKGEFDVIGVVCLLGNLEMIFHPRPIPQNG